MRRGLLALGAASLAAHAQVRAPGNRIAVLERLFRESPAQADWFAPAFLAQAPPSQIDAIIGALKQQYGAFVSAANEHGALTVHLAHADVPAQLALDPQGRIAGLFFRPPVPLAAGLDDPVDAIAALPGRTAALVTTDGNVRAAHEADAPLAVGSAFKLALLRAVAQACGDGRLAWDRVVRLDPAWRSLGSGLLQAWPAETPVTVATLANLMISLSDNTAADALIHLAGRASIEAVTPRNVPFLTTREAFVLKADASLREKWVAAGQAERSAMLATLANLPLPGPEEVAGSVTADVEWFLTAREVASLLDQTGALLSFAINKGPVEPGPWRAVAYKGGSEPGVLNLSALLVAKDGRRHCVVATWNSTDHLDEERLITPFRALVRRLVQEA